jgi:hypothetical protein
MWMSAQLNSAAMSLITLFSAPKAFTDAATATMQRNAIRSWTRLEDVEVLLLGEEEGLAEAARELGVRHVAGVQFNPSGVPLVSSMLGIAREQGNSPLLCIINADIILMSDFVSAARQAAMLMSEHGRPKHYVVLGRRWDLDVNGAMDFSDGWEQRLRDQAQRNGQLHRPAGSDFFLFPRDCYNDVPDFAIGRAGWDNWMIYKARREGWPVIDGTASMTVIHQNHDYRHLPGARPHYDHPDTRVNTQLAGGQAATRYTILDATHALVSGRLQRPPISSARLFRRVEVLLRRLFFFLPENLLESLVRPQRWSKRLKRLFGRTA